MVREEDIGIKGKFSTSQHLLLSTYSYCFSIFFHVILRNDFPTNHNTKHNNTMVTGIAYGILLNKICIVARIPKAIRIHITAINPLIDSITLRSIEKGNAGYKNFICSIVIKEMVQNENMQCNILSKPTI